MTKKTDYLRFGEVWRWVGGKVPLDVMIVAETSQTRWIAEERRVMVLCDGTFSHVIHYRQGEITAFNGFTDPRWQHIRV